MRIEHATESFCGIPIRRPPEFRFNQREIQALERARCILDEARSRVSSHLGFDDAEYDITLARAETDLTEILDHPNLQLP